MNKSYMGKKSQPFLKLKLSTLIWTFNTCINLTLGVLRQAERQTDLIDWF